MIEKQKGKEVSLENKCSFYDASREQRKHEIERREGIKGTAGFEGTGCYECDGHNKECDVYFSPLNQYNKGLSSANEDSANSRGGK